MPIDIDHDDLENAQSRMDPGDYEKMLAQLAASDPDASPPQPDTPPSAAPAPARTPAPAAAQGATPPDPLKKQIADFLATRDALGDKDDQAKLDQVRAEQADKNKMLNLAQAAGDFGAGMAGVKVDPGYYNAARDQSAQAIAGAQSDVDRNRKLVQDFLNNQRAVEVAKDNRDARIQAMKDNQALRMQLFQQNQQEKDAKRFGSFGDALDPDKSRAGNFGAQQQIVYNAKKLEALSSQFPDGNMPPAQVAELAQATANMLSGGNGAAESTVNRYVPSSVGRDAASITQWITNKPQGAQQQAFVKQMLETGQRERTLAEQNVKQIKYQRVSQFGDLQKKDPGTFNAVLLSHDIDPGEFAAYQQNGYKLPQASPTSPTAGGGNDALAAEMKKRGLL